MDEANERESVFEEEEGWDIGEYKIRLGEGTSFSRPAGKCV